ncbi:MAG: hypothetical protein KME45_19305 [Stenomitos rutilans HA7619-LM2]|jgi:hypothetical protein|nr:hypothetical protein [Stenomitos rutilans HA7619-LM2]
MTSQPPNLTALAKQGDLTAIAALMNRALQPKGIAVKVAYQKGHLRVLLEGQPIPDQTVLAPYIRKGIAALQIPGLHTLGVVGRLKGTNTSTWSETFAIAAADTIASSAPQPTEPAKPAPEAGVDDSALAEDSSTVNQESHNQEGHPAIAPTAPSATDLDAITAHLNQTMGTEALVFEVAQSDRTLKLTAKTDQILEGDTFAKTVQNLLLPLNLSDIDLIQLYKQKTKSSSPYKIKEFTLPKEPAPTEATTNDTPEPHATESTASLYQSPHSRPAQPSPINSTAQSPSQTNKSKFVMIGLVALFVVLLIGAIKLLAKPPAATEVCQDAAGAPAYCQLAVQLVGEQTLHDLKESATPFTPEMEERGVEICVNAVGAKVPRNLNRQKERYDSSIRKEPISPGVMMVEAQLKTVPQRNVKMPQASPTAEETVFRSACLFTNQDDRIRLVKHVVLPNGWPEEPYKGKQEWEPMQRSLKVYQILIMLGGGTLFTAIGLFAASAFNFGFQIYTFRGLFQTASILGTLDTLLIVLSGAHLHLFGGVPLTCLALGLTQIWVKDLRVDWASGYGSVALGVFVMIIIRFILNWLLIGFIFSVL